MSQSTGKHEPVALSPCAVVRGYAESFFHLNPDVSESDLSDLFDAAQQVDGRHFGEFAQLTERLIEAYQNSPTKRATELLLGEYFEYIDRSTRLLSAQGELSVPAEEPRQREHSVALVDPDLVQSALDWCKIMNRAAIPKPVILGVDACQRRNELLTSVVEYMLRVLQLVDFEQAIEWQLAYLDGHSGALDSDLVRDMLVAWHCAPALPRAALVWAESWSADENLHRRWPQVVRNSDRLLRQHALRRLIDDCGGRSGPIGHLRLIVRDHIADDRRLLRWLENAVVAIGESVDFFVQMNEKVAERSDTELAWRRSALMREIAVIESLFTPVVVLADLMLAVPDGASRFALALFGLAGSGRERWEKRLESQAKVAVRRMFLRDMRKSISPERLIEQLSFGDSFLFRKAIAQLDWLTKSFDSVGQREKVVSLLASSYASYREPKLLSVEIARRFRNLMRVVHEDSLRRVLDPEQFEKVQDLQVLRDLAAVAGDARRFLARRRALDATLEEMVAAEVDYSVSLRRRRLEFIHACLGQPKTASS